MTPGNTQGKERAMLVGVATPATRRGTVEEYLDELALLAESSGASVVGRMVQVRRTIDPAFFIGKGKAEELAARTKAEGIDLVLFDDDLTSVQVRNLERLIDRKIVDRSGLILDIFAGRARTNEAMTQVELAQLQYMLPRLTRQWTHLSKQFGGIGTKGPGETQIETDRRAIRTRISRLNAKLKRISKERAEQRKGRAQLPRVALVGYTNAGKSTIMNRFSGAEVLVEDRLFATLDSTVRLVSLSPVHKILLSDTVGFIRKLPHHLIASFKSTLDEVTEADILLHVVDLSHPLFGEQILVVNDTLEEIGAHGLPTIIVFNKIDKLADRSGLAALASQYGNAVFVAATRGIGMPGLEKKICESLEQDIIERTMTFRHDEYALIARIHEVGEILSSTYDGDSVTMRFRINKRHAGSLERLLALSASPGLRRT